MLLDAPGDQPVPAGGPILWSPGDPYAVYQQNLDALEQRELVQGVVVNAAGQDQAVVGNASGQVPEALVQDMDRFAPQSLVQRLAHTSGVHSLHWVTPGMVEIVTRHTQDWVQRLPGVQLVQGDSLLPVQGFSPPNPLFGLQWNLRNIGSSPFMPATAGDDIHALPAWEQSLGAGQLVAEIDNGIYTSGEPNFAPGQISPKSWSFYNNSANISPPVCSSPGTCGYSHGTGVASVMVGSIGTAGVAGVAPLAQVLGIQAGAGGQIDAADALEGIYYALQQGARVINCSWGAQGDWAGLEEIQAAIQQAQQDGAILVFAAGNDSQDIDPTSPDPALNTNPDAFYPAALSVTDPNVLSVGASTATDGAASFSDWGAQAVQLFAPGQDIPGDGQPGVYMEWSGTSVAAPEVAGAIADLWSQDPALTWEQVKQDLLSTVTPSSSLDGLAQYPGVLNLQAALQVAQQQGGFSATFSGYQDLAPGQAGTVVAQLRDPAAPASGVDLRISLAALDQGQGVAVQDFPLQVDGQSQTTNASGVLLVPAPQGLNTSTGAQVQLGIDLPWSMPTVLAVSLVPASDPTGPSLGGRAVLLGTTGSGTGSSSSSPPPSSSTGSGSGGSSTSSGTGG
ncbi:S8 family serine peptidase, partial [Aciditerrimonas ferrireducens]